MVIAFITVSVLLAFASLRLWKHRLASAREAHIRTFHFPRGLFAKVIAKYPHLTQKDMELVSHGLRHFFLAYLQSGKQYVSMPSQVADELWHEFILYTRSYQEFTRLAFGTFLHHTPAVALSSKAQSNIGLRRCWKYVCREENIDPRSPSRLPLLFALDSKLNIAKGFQYVPDCSSVRRAGAGDASVHCGGYFSDKSFDGGTDGLSETGGHGHHGGEHSSDGAGGDGGGDGCGGGCGGGD
jgi:hypothetical protein